MTARLLIAVLALGSLTAFAPAPFPRARRDRDTLNLNTFQGLWRVVSMKQTQAGGQLNAINWHITHIQVEKDVWTFLQQGSKPNATYYLTLDTSRKPGTIDWHNARGGAVTMMGLIRRSGDTVEILYLASTNRPGSFENPPQGYYLLTLKRDNS
jgi:uncharacterized protein (TIGR03067 family)